MPSRTARQSFHGRPRRSLRREGSGISGSSTSHCESVRSQLLRIIVDLFSVSAVGASIRVDGAELDPSTDASSEWVENLQQVPATGPCGIPADGDGPWVSYPCEDQLFTGSKQSSDLDVHRVERDPA
jgi:hypothetical protein